MLKQNISNSNNNSTDREKHSTQQTSSQTPQKTPLFSSLPIQDFINNLIKELGMSDSLNKDELRMQMLTNANQMVGNAILAKLSPESAEDLSDFMDTNPQQEEIVIFFKKQIPDLDLVMTDALRRFKEETLKITGKLDQVAKG